MKHTLKFDITNLKGKKILEAFPALAAYPEFRKVEDDRLLAYVMYAYDKGSGFMKHKENPMKRKEEALLEAGFTRDRKGVWNEPICNEILSGDHEQVKKVVTAFLRYVMWNRKFAYWINGSEMVWQNLDKIAEPIAGDAADKDVQATYNNRNTLFKELPNQMKALEAIEAEIFVDEETKEMVVDEVNTLNAGFMEEWANEHGTKRK